LRFRDKNATDVLQGKAIQVGGRKLAAKVRSRTEVRGGDTEKKEPIGEFGVSDEAKEFH